MSSSHCWQSNKNEKVEKGKNYQRVNEGKMIDVYNYMRWRQHLDAIERKKLMNKKNSDVLKLRKRVNGDKHDNKADVYNVRNS